ncbi:CPCC family cysteine-rich protein [Komagataeibacter melomenusus]
MTELRPCPCCKSPEISEYGEYEICRVCNWEDDPVQSADPDYSGGANKLSLNQARACHQAEAQS